MNKLVFGIVRQQLRPELENALPLLGFDKMCEHPLEFIAKDFCVRRHNIEVLLLAPVSIKKNQDTKKRITR